MGFDPVHDGAIDEVLVPVTTLDAYADQQQLGTVFMLKIDVQGLELDVLRGARAVLDRTQHVFVESAIKPLYEGAARFSDVHDFLVERGFHLMAMRSWHRGNRVLVESDMLFRRNGLEPPVDERIDRVYDVNG